MRDEEAHLPLIVLIEDNEADIYLLKLALRESGIAFQMTQFQNGDDALLSLSPARSREKDFRVPDLILLDLNIPRSDGFEVIGKLRANPRLADVPMAIVTSSPSPEDRARAGVLGAASYIQKATQLDAFIEGVGSTVRRLLAGSQERTHHAGAATS
jgi:chemotaxis family two-component system response regulator Rcp1